MIAETARRSLNVGDVVTVVLPWSEVCMHMKVADKIMKVLVMEHSAQILNDDGSRFSSPVTHGEAGIYTTGKGSARKFYTYAVKGA